MREREERKLTTWLFNPFVYVAGWEAMVNGVMVILITGSVGSLSNTHFDGVMDTHTGMPAPLWCFLSEGIISWLSMVVVLWVFGKCISKTAFRSIDLLGTQALARWPMLLTSLACLLPQYGRFTEYITRTLAKGENAPVPITDAIVFGAVIIAMITFLCWSVVLMYKSYSVSCNIKGGKAVGTFVAGIVVAEILSKAIIIPMLVCVQQDQSWMRPSTESLPETESTAIALPHEKLYTFDSDEGIEIVNGDKGLSVDIANGEVRIHGTTTDATWGPEAVKVAVIDDGGALDVSGKFRIQEREAHGLVFLEAETQNGGPLIYMYQWSPFFKMSSALEAYQIQTRYYDIPAELISGVGSMRAPGDPENEFCSLRIHVREDHQTVDFYANGVFQDTVVFEESFGPIISAKMELQTPRKGKRFDIRFDDLAVGWSESPLAAERAKMEEKTRGLMLHYTFDDDGQVAKDSSGQQAHGIADGAIRRVGGIKGSGVAFDGCGEHIEIPLTRRLRGLQNGDHTLSVWFNPSSIPEKDTDSYGILMKAGFNLGLRYRPDQRIAWDCYFAVPHELDMEAPDTADDLVMFSVATDPIALHRWHHVVSVASADTRKVRIFLDGDLVAESMWRHDWTMWQAYHNIPWCVGVAQQYPALWSWPTHGIIDDVRIYGRALSDHEVAALYAEVDTSALNGLEDSVHALAQELSDSHRGVRYRASIVLADMGPAAKSAVPALIEAAKDIEICAGPVVALGNIGIANDEVISVIMAALTHDSKWDRIQAATALSRLNATAAISSIQELLNDEDADVRAAAEQALTALQK